uniref:Uncharacterized protein n=1 Tax=Anguilla anguilla TaxID=7936 RepID=A0A0E9XFZ9_ANGAN
MYYNLYLGQKHFNLWRSLNVQFFPCLNTIAKMNAWHMGPYYGMPVALLLNTKQKPKGRIKSTLENCMSMNCVYDNFAILMLLSQNKGLPK